MMNSQLNSCWSREILWASCLSLGTFQYFLNQFRNCTDFSVNHIIINVFVSIMTKYIRSWLNISDDNKWTYKTQWLPIQNNVNFYTLYEGTIQVTQTCFQSISWIGKKPLYMWYYQYVSKITIYGLFSLRTKRGKKWQNFPANDHFTCLEIRLESIVLYH